LMPASKLFQPFYFFAYVSKPYFEIHVRMLAVRNALCVIPRRLQAAKLVCCPCYV
jgi:hypothetical protein